MKVRFIVSHRYAPELNRVVLRNGVSIPAPGVTSIKDFRRKYRPVRRGRYATIKYTNKENPQLNRTYQGYAGYTEIGLKIAEAKRVHNLPGGTFDVSIRYIG